MRGRLRSIVMMMMRLCIYCWTYMVAGASIVGVMRVAG